MVSGGQGLPEFAPGEVWLVGAGPGDPAHLTRLAVHALALAEVVVHDSLIGPKILGFANPAAELIHTGKRGGKPSPKQPDITTRVIALARAGRRVVRLKGGDPFVFARGGEEAVALAAAGIAFRVVPGITAGIGGLAAAGIPLTHRDTNVAVLLMTGHDASGAAPQTLDWELAARAPAIVLYMAVKPLGEIAARLIAAGRPADDPVALVQDATLPGQVVVETTLERAAGDAARAGIVPPVIIAIGRNAGLRALLTATQRLP